ncbi:MAG: molecular chaperone DnaJ [Gaiellales bacterium]
MAKRDYYEVLGVPREADDTEIKKAFRRLARELHPDVNPGDPAAADRFREAAEAYEVLSGAETRARYDRFGHAGVDGSHLHTEQFMDFGSLSDLLGAFFGDDLFGAGRRRPRQGGDVAVTVELTLAEAAFGVTREVEVEAIAPCERCQGTGAEPGTTPERCETCAGQGRVQRVQQTALGQFVQTGTCPTCRGRGTVVDSPCSQCRGQGRRPVVTTVEVQIPAGIMDGQRLQLRGRGHHGEPGAAPGDLYVGVSVLPDPRFQRDGSDIVSVVDVPFTEAALGVTVTVPTLDGDERVELRAGTQPSEVIVLRGRGVPLLRGRGRGDQRVIVNVLIPRKLDDNQRRLLSEFEAGVTEDTYATDGSFFGRLRSAFR